MSRENSYMPRPWKFSGRSWQWLCRCASDLLYALTGPRELPRPTLHLTRSTTKESTMDAHSAAQKEASEIVNSVVESLTERIRSGDIADEDALSDAMHEEIDDSLIYTHTHYLCVFGLPDGDDAIEDGLCSPSNFGESLAAQAYANLRAAVESHDFSDAFAESEGGES